MRGIDEPNTKAYRSEFPSRFILGNETTQRVALKAVKRRMKQKKRIESECRRRLTAEETREHLNDDFPA